jgi:hypothetical protein
VVEVEGPPENTCIGSALYTRNSGDWVARKNLVKHVDERAKVGRPAYRTRLGGVLSRNCRKIKIDSIRRSQHLGTGYAGRYCKEN